MFNEKTAFNNLMEDAMANKRIAGANILVLRDQKELFFSSYGMSNLEKGAPMKRDTVFHMFSMSKPVTSAAVMILAERGIIDLRDPVYKYLEGFKDQKVAVMNSADPKDYTLVPVNRPVTVQDLMNMTSGVCYPGDQDAAHIAVARCLDEWEPKLRGYDHPGTVDFMNALGRCPLAFQPGEHWMYGFSADVLGAVVEVASGKSYGEFLREEIFEPLHMDSTGFGINASMRERMSEIYEYDYKSDSLRPWRGLNLGLGDFPDRPIFESGGAGLLSTIDDYSRFAMMLANEGELDGARILGKNTVKYMRTNQLNDAQKVTLNWDSLYGYGYANLMRVLENPGEQCSIAPAGEFGWDGWLGTYFIVEPASKTVILYFIQMTNAGTTPDTRKVRSIAYAI